MKKVLLVIMALFVLSFNQVQAANLNKYSNDSKVISALETLQDAGITDVFTRLDKSSTKVMFYDLSLMDFSYAKHYAVASTDEYGNNYILINEKFKSAPNQAIAALIAHESVHQLAQATLEEEVSATTTEAITWIKLRGTANADSNNALVARQNKLAMMYEDSTPSRNLIQDAIAGNSFYQQQLAMK